MVLIVRKYTSKAFLCGVFQIPATKKTKGLCETEVNGLDLIYELILGLLTF